MAENNQNLGRTVSDTISSVEMENFVSGMDNKPLMRSFLKYFTQSMANDLRSVDFGKSLFRYFAPDVEMPKDPATLLNATRTLFTVGFADAQLTDEVFVRFLLNKIDKEPDLMTFDMVADLVESDAYKKFGKTAQDRNNKQKFERWLYDHSLLSKIEQCPAVDIVLNKDGMMRVINAVAPSKKNQNIDYLKQIDGKVQEFDEKYVQSVDDKTLKNLKKIARNTSNHDYITQLKDVYKVLCDQEKADYIADYMDACTMGAESKVRNSMIEGLGMTANKIMLAVKQRKNWSEKDFNDIYLKFPVEKRAEKFEEQEQQIKATNSKKQQSTVQALKAEEVTQQTINNVQNNTTKKFNPVFDVVKTFAGTLTGAAVISTITSIPGVGQVVGPVMGIAGVATAGISSAVAAYNRAKKSGEVSKTEAKKIAMQAGIAMLGKAWPYAAAMALGPAGRMLGSGVVFAKTLFNDLERRAETQQEKTKGVFSKLKHVVQAGHKIGLKESLKSLAYAAGKSAAVFLGGQMGSELGSSIGSNVSFENGKLDLDQAGVVEDLKQSKIGKLFGRFKGLNGQENAPIENIQPAGTDQTVSPVQESSDGIQLSEKNLQRLSQIGDVELTENARATAFVENDRQYVGGVQQDWYTAEGQHTAFQTLRNAGVEDPAGVLRKVGSMSRFFGGTYQDTLENLCAGKISNQDVNNIFDALHQINAEGGLGEIAKQPIYQTNQSTYEAVNEPVEVPEHTQEYKVATDELVNDLPETQYVPHEKVVMEPLEPVDVPEHTQEYRTPNTIHTAAAQTAPVAPVMENEGVDIDNSIDYIDESVYQEPTNLAMPSHTQDYQTTNDNLVEEPSSIAIPSRTQDYTVSNVSNDELQNVTYSENLGSSNQVDLEQAVPKMNLFGPNFEAQTVSAETSTATELPGHSYEPVVETEVSVEDAMLSSTGVKAKLDYINSLNNDDKFNYLKSLSPEELQNINAMIDVKNEIAHLQKLDLSDFRSAEYVDSLSNDKIKAISDYMDLPYQEINPENDSFVAMRAKNTANRDAVWDRLQSQHDFTWKTATPGSSEMKPLESAMAANQAKAQETLDLIMQDQGMER